MPSKKTSTSAKPEDDATGDVNRGVARVTMSEDEKRAAGLDAGADAGPHDYSPEAQPFQAAEAGSTVDTYRGMPSGDHTNMVGEGFPLVVGQAPVASAHPMRGSAGTGQKLDPNIPNAIHQSPVVRGLEIDPRNDPTHPEHDAADKTHPDYGKAGQEHVGRRTVAPTYADLKAEADAPADKAPAEEAPATS